MWPTNPNFGFFFIFYILGQVDPLGLQVELAGPNEEEHRYFGRELPELRSSSILDYFYKFLSQFEANERRTRIYKHEDQPWSKVAEKHLQQLRSSSKSGKKFPKLIYVLDRHQNTRIMS